MPKVSVVISTYQRSDRLKQAIESVEKQTFTDWELIVVHDGPWEMGEIKTPGDNHRFVYYGLPEHFGTDTRPKNEGIKRAKTDLIAFLDDDVVWRPDHLQALVQALDQHPEVAGVYGDRWLIDETGQIPAQIGVFHNWSTPHLLMKNYIDTSDVLIRKAVLEDLGGFDERYRKFVDWNLWVRLAKAGYELMRVPKVLTDYHLHQDSKSMRPEDEKAPLTPAWNPIDLEIHVPFLGPVAPPRVAIFSLTMNRLEMTKQCFQSLSETAGYAFDHFVVDNGSTDGTVEWLKEYEKAHATYDMRFNPENVGISRASNQALDVIARGGTRWEYSADGTQATATRTGPYDIILKVDNDAFFPTQDWLKAMVELWKVNHLLALSPSVQGLRDNPGGSAREAYGVVKGEYLGLTTHLGGICVMADKKAWNFRWPEDDFLHAAQDVEFSKHLRERGFQPAYLENYYVSHGPEGTEAQEKQYPDYFEQRKTERRTRYQATKPK